VWAHIKIGPTIHYSVDLRIQTYMEPVPLEYVKLATKYPWICGYFFTVQLMAAMRFCRVLGRDRHTDRQTDRPRYIETNVAIALI